MTATEAKIKAIWNSLPIIIQSYIKRDIEEGKLYTCLYKSVYPETFKNIDTTITKLQSLGYNVECSECYTVNAALYSDPSSTIPDTKLTINW